MQISGDLCVKTILFAQLRIAIVGIVSAAEDQYMPGLKVRQSGLYSRDEPWHRVRTGSSSFWRTC